MSQTYRVRYSLKPSTQHHGGADVVTADIESDLEGIPAGSHRARTSCTSRDLTAAGRSLDALAEVYGRGFTS